MIVDCLYVLNWSIIYFLDTHKYFLDQFSTVRPQPAILFSQQEILVWGRFLPHPTNSETLTSNFLSWQEILVWEAPPSNNETLNPLWDWSEFFMKFYPGSKIHLLSTCGIHWSGDLHLLLLELAPRRLGVAREQPRIVVCLGKFVKALISPPQGKESI
jgi:hypothetical protein